MWTTQDTYLSLLLKCTIALVLVDKFNHINEAHLVNLVNHEANCPQRTIKCPYLGCSQVVRIRKYYDHALSNNCAPRNNLLFPTRGNSICSSRITTRQNVQRYLDSTDVTWKLHAFEERDKLFYFHQHYFSDRQTEEFP